MPNASIVRGLRLGEQVVECHVLESRITFPVTFCTRYVNRQHPSVREMEEIAWILRTDSKRHHIGFVQSKQLPWKERFILDDE